MADNILLNYVKKPTKFSHSRLEVFENCPYRYNLKYNEEKRTNDTTLALELGTLLHYVLEQKGHMLLEGSVDYEKLYSIIENGVTELDGKTKEIIPGINELKKKYFEEWFEKDEANNMNYDEKMKIYDNVLHSEMEDDEQWEPYAFEYPFDFAFVTENGKEYTITGFIDRIDINNDGEFRVVDYKTSKKIFDEKKLPTSQQFSIYAMAILNDFGKMPVDYVYRFILLDKTQHALTKGWEKRIVKKIDKMFSEIENSNGIWTPKPTPLCHWCDYCETNPRATKYKKECEYYSLWTPSDKTFKANKKFSVIAQPESQPAKKKLIF